MGIGIGLGGIAQGLQSGAQGRARNRALDIQQQGAVADQGLRKRALSIQEKQLQRGQQQDLMGQAGNLISQEMSIISDVVKASKEAGHSPEQITSAIEPLLADIDSLASAAGRDPTMIRRQVNAVVNAPGTMGDPADRKKELEVQRLENEIAVDKARVEDVKISAGDALEKIQTLKKIPGAEFFMLNPGAVPTVRQAISSQQGTGLVAKLQTALGVNELPSALLGMSKENLKKALDAAETVGKQRNAIAQLLQGSQQAGAAGLKSQLTARGEGAGLDVQEEMFKQVLGFTDRVLGSETPVSMGPLPIPDTEAQLKNGQVYNLPDGRQALWNGKAFEVLN